MNFYFSLFELMETVDRLEKNIQHLASRALRISPRDARANRELLEQCEMKIRETRLLLNNKTHISKITLRKASLLFQLLETYYRRVLHLSASTTDLEFEDETSARTLWNLLSTAQRQYQALVKTLFDLTGIPVSLNLDGTVEEGAHGLAGILQKEAGFQQDALKVLDKAIEVFGEEQELADQLARDRKELLDLKRRLKHQGTPEKTEAPKAEKPQARLAPLAPAPAKI
ncbi:MAG TPA: hypothetical protein VHE12_07840 [bacterium]|nr:hypothetical protein [bacterium]